MSNSRLPKFARFIREQKSQGYAVTRRDFIRYSAGTFACFHTSALNAAVGRFGIRPPLYPIDSTVVTTTERVVSFPYPITSGLSPTQLPLISEYSTYGYGEHTFGSGLPIEQRFDIMTEGYSNPAPVRRKLLSSFFAISDIHITDKEAPNQLIYLQQGDARFGAPGTSLYSPVMLSTTQVLDAAVQTINVLHRRTPFDFGISLGDAANSSQFNELRWYIDVLDGKLIIPSSGAHLGDDTIDYQKPFQAAGLDKSIPWYQVLGNHDHFYLGSVPIDADPSLGIREAYTSNEIWALGDVVFPNEFAALPQYYPCMCDTTESIKQRTYYMGTINGSTPTGTIEGAGPVAQIGNPLVVAADLSRRPLLRSEWIEEFFDTGTAPVGHGFNLADRILGEGFACYSFLPKTDIPLKVIVLDDTQSETDGSHDIHGHAFLDSTRWNWLQAELADGQAKNQLMIIAAHVPIAVDFIGSEVEWWESEKDPDAIEQNAVNLYDLIKALQGAPNLLMWIAGHRHLNTVKALLPLDSGSPENGFWQVETCALRDFPQQFRTFEIYLNSDYTVSIVTTNVDAAVAEGTPAAKSRSYAIAAQQIVQTDHRRNVTNAAEEYGIPVESMDPTRPQNGNPDPTIIYGSPSGVPYCASYNAELFKQLSPTMVNALKALFRHER